MPDSVDRFPEADADFKLECPTQEQRPAQLIYYRDRNRSCRLPATFAYRIRSELRHQLRGYHCWSRRGRILSPRGQFWYPFGNTQVNQLIVRPGFELELQAELFAPVSQC